MQVTTNGGISSSSGSHADGAYNGPFGSYSGGGHMSITNSTIVTNGSGAIGVGTSTGGVTTLTGSTILTTGSEAYGVDTNSGGATTVAGGSVTTSGLHAIGVLTQRVGNERQFDGNDDFHFRQWRDGCRLGRGRIVPRSFRSHDHHHGNNRPGQRD